MKIYVGHSRNFDYLNELYKPLKEEVFLKKHELILPHENNNYEHNRDFYKQIDLFIFECSEPSTGLGIELAFAYDDKKPIYCFYRDDKKISDSIKVVTNNIYSYHDSNELINLIKTII